jgi:hypothetical protein
MTDDPIISEVRRHRASILNSHGGDMRRYHAGLQQDQARRFAGQLVTLEPRRIVEPDGPANRSQPIRSKADSTPSAADSRR